MGAHARRAARVVGLLAAALLASLLLLEAATRLLGFHGRSLAEPAASDRALWRWDATKGWCQAPRAHGTCYYGGPDSGAVRTNSLGLRGREPRPAGSAARIVVLGDSFVFGVGVDEGHLFTTKLETQLAAYGHAAEVVNLGVSGYSTDQELILLQELGPRLRPELVVLVMCDNDFEGNLLDFMYRRYHKPAFELSSGGHLVLRNAPPVPSLRGAALARLWLGEHSNLWNLVRERRSARPSLQAWLDGMQPGLPQRSSAEPVALAAALVAALDQTCRQLGARLVLVNAGQRGERVGFFHALRPLLDEQHVLYEGLEQVLGAARQGNPSGVWDFKDDTHWNVDAHRVAARTMASFLERRVYREAKLP